MAWLLRLWLSIDHFDLLDNLLASCGTQVTLFWLVLLVAIVVEASIHTLLFICSTNVAKKAQSGSQRVGGSKSRWLYLGSVFWLVPVKRCHQPWETPCIPAVNVANKPLAASFKRLKEMELVLMDLDDAVDLLMDLWMREPEDTAEVA
jgi:hypothetical protein